MILDVFPLFRAFPGGLARPLSPLLTRREAAERLHVSLSTVRRLGADGLITEVRVGRRAVRIDPASVEAHIRSRSRRSARRALEAA